MRRRNIMNEEKLQYPPYDEETGRLHCQVCGKKFLIISPKHLLKHNISYAEYTTRYPDAPLSSKEFAVKTKYGKVKDLFAPPEVEEFEEVIVTEEPDIEDDIDVGKILRDRSHKDPVKQSKAIILDTLKTYFTNIRQDYMIDEFGPVSGRLKFHFITDFADPILKIVVQFPKTFWHNKDTQIDPLKNQRLKECGWKVITINSKAPSPKDIQQVVDRELN